MSTREAEQATALPHECPILDGRRTIQRVPTRASDVGGIQVVRALPAKGRRLVGSWCFLDHFGPADRTLSVGAHPHTGLQTFTWMIAGRIFHRDSIGNEQEIRPGQVNLMTAGRGIAHTEDSVDGTGTLHGVQLWIALPREQEHREPCFDHYPDLPRFEVGPVAATLLTGEYGDHMAPTLQYSPLVALDLEWAAATDETFSLRPDFEYGVLPLEGKVRVNEQTFGPDELAYLGINNDRMTLSTDGPGRALLIGGVPHEGEVTIWWNFVAHDRAEIERATGEWNAGSDRFGDIQNPRGGRMTAPAVPWRRE